MCETLNIDGVEYTSIRDDGSCLCDSTVPEIFAFIGAKTDPQIDEKVIIKHTPFDWEVTTERNEK